MLFVLQQPQEECMEQNANLFSTYVVLTQGFDTVSRKSLWRIMAKYGCPRKFNVMVQQLLRGVSTLPSFKWRKTGLHPVTNTVQAHVLSNAD